GTFDGFEVSKVIQPKNRSNGSHPKQALHLQWQDEASYEVPLHYFNQNAFANELVISLANYAEGKKLSMTVTVEMSEEKIIEETVDISPVITIEQTPFGLLDEYYRDGKYTKSWEPIFETI